MAAPDGIFESRAVRFIVGPDSKTFDIHSEALAKLSPALDALLNGPMKEAVEGRVEWDDIDVSTFQRVCRFAYTQDFEVPTTEDETAQSSISAEHYTGPPELQQDHPVTPHQLAKPPERDEGWKKEWRHIGPRQFLTAFRRTNQYKASFAFTRLFTSMDFSAVFIPDYEKETDVCYTGIFLAYARVYVFADRYGVDALKDLVLCKLQRTLLKFPLETETVADLASLVRYTYENTQRIDRLRDLLAAYCLAVFKYLENHQSFKETMDDLGEFSTDLLKKMMSLESKESFLPTFLK